MEVYEDQGIGGAKGRDQRPALDQLMKDAARRKIDRLLVWSADRLGRSTAQMATIMAELNDHGVKQFYHKEGIDTSTNHGKAMLQMAAVFAELERGIMQERIKAGLDRARAEGKKLGRPGLSNKVKHKVKQLKTEGLSVRKIARKVDISPSAVQKIVTA